MYTSTTKATIQLCGELQFRDIFVFNKEIIEPRKIKKHVIKEIPSLQIIKKITLLINTLFSHYF